MPSPSASREEVGELLGDIDELIIERIVATGATIDEIAEALLNFEDEQQFGASQAIPSSTRVVEVRTILDELPLDFDDDDEMPPIHSDLS